MRGVDLARAQLDAMRQIALRRHQRLDRLLAQRLRAAQFAELAPRFEQLHDLIAHQDKPRASAGSSVRGRRSTTHTVPST